MERPDGHGVRVPGAARAHPVAEADDRDPYRQQVLWRLRLAVGVLGAVCFGVSWFLAGLGLSGSPSVLVVLWWAGWLPGCWMGFLVPLRAGAVLQGRSVEPRKAIAELAVGVAHLAGFTAAGTVLFLVLNDVRAFHGWEVFAVWPVLAGLWTSSALAGPSGGRRALGWGALSAAVVAGTGVLTLGGAWLAFGASGWREAAWVVASVWPGLAVGLHGVGVMTAGGRPTA